MVHAKLCCIFQVSAIYCSTLAAIMMAVSFPHHCHMSGWLSGNSITNAFKHKNGATRYTHLKVGSNKSYFSNDVLNGDNKYTANDISKVTESLVDNIYLKFGGQLFRQTVGVPMGTNCAPLLADLFLYSYENEFLDQKKAC